MPIMACFGVTFLEKNTILYVSDIVVYTKFTTFAPRFPQKADEMRE
jgi:hypothetical protein